MDIQTNFLTQNDCYRVGGTMAPVGIVVHDTATDQRRVEPYLTSWNRGGVKKCVHAFIGQRPDGSFGVVQTLPWEMRCWGCGSGIRGTYNRDHIQFELCQDDRSDPEWCKKCYDEAVELCAYLCRRYGFGAEDIVDHAEAHARGYASNHGDTDDWFPLHGRNMDSLRREVQALLDGRKAEPEPAVKPVGSGKTGENEKGATCEVTLRVLRRGKKGGDVRAMQRLLIAEGFSCGSAGADGVFGGGSEAALKAFQRSSGLSADGIAGTKTWTRLLGG